MAARIAGPDPAAFVSPHHCSASFDCVNGRNVHVPDCRVFRSRDQVAIYWAADADWARVPVGSVGRLYVRDNLFWGVMRRRGILAVFGPYGTPLAEDVVRVNHCGTHRGNGVALAYRYHPRGRRSQ